MREYPVIVALDGMSREQAIAIARQLAGRVWGFKVHTLVTRYGFGIITTLKQFGKVFLDMKYHDTPHTVIEHVRAAFQHGADMVSVHARSGPTALKGAVSEEKRGTLVVAITDLTSQTDSSRVLELATLAHTSGVRAVVCSAHEARQVLARHNDLLVLTPAIRPQGSSPDDQARVATAQEALENGAHLLVIGRPITRAPDPKEALSALIPASLSKACAPLSIVPQRHE